MSSSAATPASGQPVTLRTTSPQAPLGERPAAQRVDYLGQRLDGEPVKLDILANGDIGQVAGVFARDPAD
jgi:hypothetical protein